MKIIDEFEKLKKDKKALLLPSYFNLKFDWNDGVALLNNASNDNNNLDIMKSFEEIGFNTKGSLATRAVAYFQSLISFPSQYKEIDDVIKSIYKDLNCHENIPQSHQVFTNLSGGDYSSSKHKDNWGVVYIQLIGQTGWKIYKELDTDLVLQEFIMKPGDVAVFDKGTIHEVSADSPRMAISCALPGGLIGSFSKYLED
jgi:hypothetical protein